MSLNRPDRSGRAEPSKRLRAVSSILNSAVSMGMLVLCGRAIRTYAMLVAIAYNVLYLRLASVWQSGPHYVGVRRVTDAAVNFLAISAT